MNIKMIWPSDETTDNFYLDKNARDGVQIKALQGGRGQARTNMEKNTEGR